jgi:hypothetical protein
MMIIVKMSIRTYKRFVMVVIVIKRERVNENQSKSMKGFWTLG